MHEEIFRCDYQLQYIMKHPERIKRLVKKRIRKEPLQTAPSIFCIPESTPIHTKFTLPTDGFRPTLPFRDIFAAGKPLT